MTDAIEVRELESRAEMEAALDLLTAIWGEPPMSPHLLVAIVVGGGYAVGAWADRALVGATIGFAGVVDGEVHLHSHVAGVDPARRRSGVGAAMKWHQHDWCAARGIEVVTWTFDPLVRRNARFNLVALGAVGERYVRNLYGAMTDAVNRGDESDRLLVRWDVGGIRATAARAGRLAVPDRSAAPRRVATPDDIESLRRSQPATAARWRLDVRTGLEAAMASGLVPTAVDDDGAYVLSEPRSAGGRGRVSR